MDEPEPRTDDSEDSEEPTEPAREYHTLAAQARNWNLILYAIFAIVVALIFGRCWA